jgi:hypothetical protein
MSDRTRQLGTVKNAAIERAAAQIRSRKISASKGASFKEGCSHVAST